MTVDIRFGNIQSFITSYCFARHTNWCIYSTQVHFACASLVALVVSRISTLQQAEFFGHNAGTHIPGELTHTHRCRSDSTDASHSLAKYTSTTSTRSAFKISRRQFTCDICSPAWRIMASITAILFRCFLRLIKVYSLSTSRPSCTASSMSRSSKLLFRYSDLEGSAISCHRWGDNSIVQVTCTNLLQCDWDAGRIRCKWQTAMTNVAKVHSKPSRSLKSLPEMESMNE